MSPRDLVTIAKYGDPQEASMAKALLESEGITGVAVGGTLNNMLWHLGPTITGVELQVFAEDAERATEILESLNEAHESPGTHHPTLDWVCPQCGADVDAKFEVCWSCGTPFDQSNDVTSSVVPAVSHNQVLKVEAPEQEDTVEKSESTDELEDEESPPDLDRKADRAFRTAVLSILVPFLLPYAIYQLLQLASQDLSKPATKKFYKATWIVLLLLLPWLFMLIRVETSVIIP
ncbi:MAG: DUF2007 domain-containing protein [Planctomycetaceae bacterium]|nr:DUF2007 domain-containing protein [Planctomycetaceae bacterium]